VSQPPDWVRRLADGVRDLDTGTLIRGLPEPPPSARESAVLMLLGEGVDGPDLVLIERAHDMRSHAGQVALPGGASDPDDDSPSTTALREAKEEIGLDPDGVDVLVELPALWLPPSNFAVTTVLAWWRQESPIGVVDAGEVASVLRAPLRDLVNPEHRFTVRHPSGHQGPGFAVSGPPGELVLWGFTAGVVDQVLRRAGLEQPWDRSRTQPAPVPAVRPEPPR